MKTTLQRLQTIVAKDYKIEIAQVTPDSSLESLGIDSLGVAELLFSIEEEFQVTLPMEPVLDLATVRDVARFIDTLIAEKATEAVDTGPSSQATAPSVT